jgi:hypothetical protein
MEAKLSQCTFQGRLCPETFKQSNPQHGGAPSWWDKIYSPTSFICQTRYNFIISKWQIKKIIDDGVFYEENSSDLLKCYHTPTIQCDIAYTVHNNVVNFRTPHMVIMSVYTPNNLKFCFIREDKKPVVIIDHIL